MARDLTPIVKRSRREGVALHPKAYKVMLRRKSLPGQMQNMRRSKPSQYSFQLREKQKVKRLYGLLEKPFRKLLDEAERKEGVTGEVLLQLLERRMDNAVYRLQWATSRQAARQLVSHGHVLLNDRRVDIPSIRVKPGDTLEVRAKSKNNAYFTVLAEQLTGDLPSYSWLSMNKKQLSAKITGLPTRDEADPDISERLIVEFYSR